MKKKNRVLKLEKLGELNGVVAFKIAEQSHINHEFGNAGLSNWDFKAKNGVRLSSSSEPEVENNTLLYVRGDNETKDNLVLMAKSAVFDAFEEAVRQYNEYFSRPPFEKIVMFRYDGGSTGDYRRIGVTEETETHIKGIDLDNNNVFRCFKKSLIVGKVLTVKD